jgi:hypothetical protein
VAERQIALPPGSEERAMAYEQVPFPVLIVRAKADLRHYRVQTVEWHREFLERMSASRDLLSESKEALAKADQVLERRLGV